MSCAVCDAAEHAPDDTLATLVRRQAVTIDRLRTRLDSFGLARVEARVRELEEILARTNAAQPQKTAVDVCRELALTDPRDQVSLRCVWCGRVGGGNHAGDCAWQRAVVVAGKARDRETRAVVDRWRTG